MTDATNRAEPARRSLFLVAVTFFANGWLFAFGLDGLLSVADDLLKSLAGFHDLEVIRNGVALAVLFLAPVLILVLIFVPHLPKRVLLPVALCALWANLVAWPFPVDLSSPLANIYRPLVQLVFFLLALYLVRRRTDNFHLRAGDLPMKTHLLRRTFIAAGATLLLLLLALPVLGAMLFATTVESQTGGYLDFTLKGVEARETALAKGERTVRLVGMVHIGDGVFYEELFDGFPPDAVILAEGVSDKKGRLSPKFSYKGVAQALGLAEQVEVQAAWAGRAAAKARATGSSGSPRPAFVHADLDAADLSDRTIRFLAEISDIYGANSIWDALSRMSKMDERFTEADIAAIFADIIDKRNAKLIETFDKLPATANTVIIPWGAQHMPDIEKALRERGFEVTSRKRVTVVDYRSLL